MVEKEVISIRIKQNYFKPDLFRKFENEHSVSFCYSDDPLKENDDSTILYNFSK